MVIVDVPRPVTSYGSGREMCEAGGFDRDDGGGRQIAVRLPSVLVAVASLAACYLATLGVVAMLSTKPAWATYVCLQEDAEEAAEERWGWEVVQGQTVYDPDRYGYWVTMLDQDDQIQVKFIAIDC